MLSRSYVLRRKGAYAVGNARHGVYSKGIQAGDCRRQCPCGSILRATGEARRLPVPSAKPASNNIKAAYSSDGFFGYLIWENMSMSVNYKRGFFRIFICISLHF